MVFLQYGECQMAQTAMAQTAMAQTARNRKDVERELTERARTDDNFRQDLLANPKSIITREFGIGSIPDDLEIIAVEETPNKLYIVVPPKTTQNPTDLKSKTNTKWIFF